MATDNSKHRRRQRGIITADFGGVTIAFGPHIKTRAPVVRLTVIDAAGSKARTTAVALELEDARELRNTLNAVIGLIATDERSS
jgi:hypothetical protein